MSILKSKKIRSGLPERHILGNYTKIITKKSVINGTDIFDKIKLMCPNCEFEQSEPKHNKEFSCPGCGLIGIATGNRLTLYPDSIK